MIGAVIRRRRLAAGLSQEALAVRAELGAASVICDVERGKRKAGGTLETLVRIAAALGTMPSTLLAEAGL